jgi:hypothetical protein
MKFSIGLPHFPGALSECESDSGARPGMEADEKVAMITPVAMAG